MPARSTRSAAVAVAAALATGSLTLAGCNLDAGTGLWLRHAEPVVLRGSDVTALLGEDPDDVVAFRYDVDAGAWDQVPVQVDERHIERLAKLRDGVGTTGPTALAYSDPGANAGPDPVATLDADDEVALMADDTGGPAPDDAPEPAGVVPGSGLHLAVTDPLAGADQPLRGAGTGHVYLFLRSGSLDPAAGVDYVAYDFSPVDPTGQSEDSTVSTDTYATHFSSRWARDELRLGGGPDLLDRHRNQFAPGFCGRSEDTFSAGGGGYATNVDGPVRAIRSYLGANSGPYTQREHVFYRQTERIQTFLRTHAIPGIMDFYDHSAAAVGMRYRSSTVPNGVAIDGVPDAVPSDPPAWEAVTGRHGMVVSTSVLDTDAPAIDLRAYYSDDATPVTTQCTGDAFEYGASGTQVVSPIPNTDPALPEPAYRFVATRWNVYAAPGQPSGVEAHTANLASPLTVAVAPR